MVKKLSHGDKVNDKHLLTPFFSSAEPTDSGRYGVLATNAAGRAESLADVMVTPLIMDKAPITTKVTFTDITDEAKVCISPRTWMHLGQEGEPVWGEHGNSGWQ